MDDGEATRSEPPGISTTALRVTAIPGDTVTDEPEHYELAHQIGAGGMGLVMAAKSSRFGRPVAVKMITIARDDLIRRFEREAAVTARLQHPAIVPVYGAGRGRDGLPYYVMKQVTGEPLDKVIAKATTLAERIALLPKVIAVSEAIAYAHAEKVIHRDLKPANILAGAFGETVIIDWGLAKDARASDDEPAVSPYRTGSADETAIGQVMGTPAYMPREQARGDKVDERADVYALGAILYHVLAGAAPFKRANENSVPWETMVARVLSEEPAPLPDGVPPDLLAIVNRAMALEPGDRYASAGELADDLRRFQAGQLVGAHTYSTWQLVRRWLRRYRLPVLVAAILLAVLAVVSVISVQRIQRERNDAEAARATAEDQRGKAVASKHEADDLMGFMLGDLKDKLVPVGKLDILADVANKAMSYYEKQDAAATDDDKRKRAQAFFNVGDVLAPKGNVDGALEAYRASLAIRETLTTPADVADTAYSHLKVGDMLYTKSKSKEAMAEYRTGLALADKAAATDPTSLAFMHQQAMGHADIGDALGDASDEKGALAEYRTTEAIRKQQTAREPTNTHWLRSLAIAELEVGDALWKTGDLASSIDEHRAAIAVLDKATKLEPDNMQFVRELGGAHERTSRILLQVNKIPEAIAEIQLKLDIAERLVQRDPTNTEWGRDLATAYFNLGDARRAANDHKGALAAYRQALATNESLSARDPSNVQWRHDAVLAHQRIGTELVTTGDLDGGKAEFEIAGKVIEQMLAADPSNLTYQLDRAANHRSLGSVLLEANTPPAVRASTAEFAAAAALFQALADKDPSNLDAFRRLETATQSLGDSYEIMENPLAIETYHKCQAMLDKLYAAQPERHEHLFNQLVIHFNLGELAEHIHQGDPHAEYQAALDIGDQLVKLEPQNAQYAGARKQAADSLAKCCKK